MSDLSCGGTLLYKCRHCGEIDGTTHTPQAMATIIWLLRDTPLPQEWGGMPVNKTDLHYCNDGQIGVCDLIGAKLDEES